MKKIIKTAGLLCIALLMITSCGESKSNKLESIPNKMDEALPMDYPEKTEDAVTMKNVVDVVLSDIEFSTLAKSLKNAELIDALQEMENITLSPLPVTALKNCQRKKLPI